MANQESRVKKSLLNARVNLVFYFLTLALSFFSRKIFLDTLGADFVGLTTTLQNLLGFLNLAELGIGSAIGYVLYKPLFEHDEGKINEIISVFGYLYRWIGFIILGAGLVLGAFLPLIFPNTMFELGVIYFAYFAFLTSSLIGYFINYRQTLLGADQKNYVVTAYFQSATIIKTLVQMASAWYTGSYYLWVAIELSFGIVYSFILNWKINQTYPWLRSEVKLGKKLFKKYPEVMKYTKQLFVHQITSFIQLQTTPFLTYTFVSLQIVAYYGNYTLIVSKLTILMNTVLGSTSAGVGNLIAEGNKGKIKKVFWELSTIRYFFAGLLFFSLYMLFDSFITLWIGRQYVLGHTVLLLTIIAIYVQVSLGCMGMFLYGYGLFADVWAAILQSVIFIVVAILGGLFVGLPGIVFASIVSMFLVIGIWKPYYLWHYGFKDSVIEYWLNWGLMNAIEVASVVCSYLVINNYFKPAAISLFEWIKFAIVVMVIFFIVNALLMYIFNKYARNLIHRFITVKHENTK